MFYIKFRVDFLVFPDKYNSHFDKIITEIKMAPNCSPQQHVLPEPSVTQDLKRSERVDGRRLPALSRSQS